VPGVGDTVIEYGTDTTRAIASLLYSGTAARYPDIRFIMSHAGGTMPFLASRFLGGSAAYLVDGGKIKPGAPPERIRETMPKGPLYELQKFYWDTANAANPISLMSLKRLLPFSQILFGADFPFANLAEDRKLLAASDIFNEKELEQMGYDHVVQLLPKYRA
jgi:predicted TIM-barrel fold metal-dependent hydrolase